MIIFLDMDGVIVSYKSYNMELDALKNLKELCHLFHANIVLSSSWRKSKALYDFLKRLFHYLDINLIGKTGYSPEGRGQEILNWMNENKYTGNYIVLDDEVCDIIDIVPNENIYKIEHDYLNENDLKNIINKILKNNETS